MVSVEVEAILDGDGRADFEKDLRQLDTLVTHRVEQRRLAGSVAFALTFAPAASSVLMISSPSHAALISGVIFVLAVVDRRLLDSPTRAVP